MAQAEFYGRRYVSLGHQAAAELMQLLRGLEVAQASIDGFLLSMWGRVKWIRGDRLIAGPIPIS